MNMHQDGLGDYRMINTVTAFVPEARIGWGPSMDPDCDAAKNFEGVDVSGHTYTWDLREAEGRTEVTETYEWTGVKDPVAGELFPLVSQEDLERSLDSSPPSANASCADRRRRDGVVADHHAGAATHTPWGGEHRVERERTHLQILGEPRPAARVPPSRRGQWAGPGSRRGSGAARGPHQPRRRGRTPGPPGTHGRRAARWPCPRARTRSMSRTRGLRRSPARTPPPWAPCAGPPPRVPGQLRQVGVGAASPCGRHTTRPSGRCGAATWSPTALTATG
jgi:hypothetical protein